MPPKKQDNTGPGRRRPVLSERQKAILAFIRRRVAKFGYPPTFREIGAELNLKSTNGVSDHLKTLRKKGYLTFEDAKSRTLKPLDGPAPQKKATKSSIGAQLAALPDHLRRIPVLGRVAAGQPILAPEDARPEDHVVVDRRFLRGSGPTFALEVEGDSMIEAGIADGDTVFVRSRDHAESGDIAVVLIEQEVTLKRYFKEPKRLRLQPENARLDPIFIYPDDARSVRILGVVIGLYHAL